jgi:hypothetical protein
MCFGSSLSHLQGFMSLKLHVFKNVYSLIHFFVGTIFPPCIRTITPTKKLVYQFNTRYKVNVHINNSEGGKIVPTKKLINE